MTRTTTPAALERPLKTAPAGIRHTDRADAAWTAAVAALNLRPSTVDSWITPATVLGELDGSLCVEADRRVADWMRRRFGAALGEAIRAKSDLTGLRVFDRGQS